MLNSKVDSSPVVYHPSSPDTVQATKSVTSWTVLPDELVCSILSRLPFSDLASCQSLDRRTAQVIGDCLLLPRAFWRKSAPVLREDYFSTSHYRTEYRQWLLTAGRDDQIAWLDSLQAHRHFPKALFFSVTKVLGQAEQWRLEESSYPGSSSDELLCISPDGTTLVLKKQELPHTVTIVTINSQEECHISIECAATDEGFGVRFGECSLAISRSAEFVIVNQMQGHWTETFRMKFDGLADGYINQRAFSKNDTHLLITSSSADICILERSGERWHQKTAMNFGSTVSGTNFLLGGQGLLIRELDLRYHFIHFGNSKADCTFSIDPDHDEFLRPLINSCGTSVILWGDRRLIIDFIDGKWINTGTLHQEVCTAEYSPDGNLLAVLSYKLLERKKGGDRGGMPLTNWVRILSFNGSSWLQTYEIETSTVSLREPFFYITFSTDSTKLIAIQGNKPFLCTHFIAGKRWIAFSCLSQENSGISSYASFSPSSLALVCRQRLFDSISLMRFKKSCWVETAAWSFGTWTRSFQFTPDGRKLVVFKMLAHKGASVYEIIPEPQKTSRMTNTGTTEKCYAAASHN